MRWRIFSIWVAITVVIMAFAVSDFLFNKTDARRLGLRLALACVWPLALLSSAGRELLFRSGRGL